MSLFLISDTHFGHAKMCQFTNQDGSKMRPWDNVDEMDEALVKNWNDTVKQGDTVYHLGDVAIPRKSLAILARLNGRKALIRGNHDIYKLSDYAPYFYDVRGAHVRDGFLFSHIPCHPSSIERYTANVHGHLHGSQVTMTVRRDFEQYEQFDPRYYCVCVERTNFAPIAWEEVMQNIQFGKDYCMMQ